MSLIPRQNNLPSTETSKQLKEYAELVFESGLIPDSLVKEGDTKKMVVSKISVVLLKGYELKLSPMQSLHDIFIINKMPSMYARTMLALIYRDVPSAEIIYDEMTTEKCVIRARRKKSHEFTKFTYTIKDAIRAGNTVKNARNWKQHPRQLLRWRCVSNMARTLFPDVIMGCYIPEEIGGDIEEIRDTKKEKEEEIIIDERIESIPSYSSTYIDVESEDITTTSTDFPKKISKKKVLEKKKEEKKQEIKKTIKETTKEDEIFEDIDLDLDFDLDFEEKEEKKQEIKKSEKASVKSAMDKIHKITKKTSVKKEKKVKVKKEKKNLDFKKLRGDNFYNSFPSPDMIQQDLPWNILKTIIVPIVNTEKENVFNGKIGKIFSQFTLDGGDDETNASNLYDAYIQYYEVNLGEKYPEIEEIFVSKMNEIIQNIYDQLLKEETTDPSLLLNNLLKNTKIDKDYKNWISDFIIEHEWIKIDNNKVKKLI